MAKNLKLTGLVSYTGLATMKDGVSVVVKNGEVCRFEDAVAEKVLEGFRVNRENQEVPYFEEVAGDTPINHNFTNEEVKTVKSDTDALTGRPVRAAAPASRARQRRAAATA